MPEQRLATIVIF